jgi:hypothetical protein
MTRDQAHQLATAFVRATGIASGRIPAARWVSPVCLKVAGLAPEQVKRVEERMKAIAASAEVRIGRPGCETNVLVFFTQDAGAFVREVARRSPNRLAEVPRDAREALVGGDAPVRWWYSTQVQSSHGMGETEQTFNTSGDAVMGVGVRTQMSGGAISHYDSSVVSTQVRRALHGATVVVDADKVGGRSLEAIASFAAMVAFAEIRRADVPVQSSILSLFDAPAPPIDLTAQDLAFLRALYRLPLDREAVQHRGELVRGITEALASQK